ncbi:MAG: SIMPL domain-containing protein [Pyrinomonadaceae bacterium]|nr:SIMPL domain-containing protein [Pyrinomonadaceae bacterium]MBP6212141.1 SIMPL domain-containing protein [Pyrinomonadaceae bacterium]
MKRSIFLMVCLLAFAAVGYAQEIDKMPSVTVTGTSIVKIAPDEVVFSLDFTKTDKDLQIARKQNDESVAKMLDLARKFGVNPNDIKTDNISVEMKYTSIRDPKKRIFDEDGDEIGTKIFKGYEVSKSVTVRLKEIKRFEEFFAEILKTGITEVDSVRFETSKLRENKDKARDMAMKAAREKATALAGAINQTIGKAIKITEINVSNVDYSGLNSNSTVAANFVSGSTSVSESLATFAPGAIKVEAQVTVTFLLN